MNAFSLQQMLSPVSFEAFCADYFERAPLHVARNDAGFYERLCSLEELDAFVENCRPPYTKAFAIDERRKIATEEFADANGQVDALRLFRLFGEGATVVFREVEAHFPALASLCRSVEKHVNAPCVANVYWAPAGGRCFPVHYDAKDVFALQLSGSKRWRLYAPQRPLPLPTQHCYDGLPDEGLLQECDLRAGDMLYCPRGFPHSVSAGDEPSLHISVSTTAITWADLMTRAMADVFDAEPGFRASVAAGFLSAPDEALEREFARLVRSFAEKARMQPALDALRRQFAASRPPRPEDARTQAARAEKLTPDTWIASRDDVVHVIEQSADAVALVGLGREIRFHPSAREALEHALRAPWFQAGDAPGGLEPAAKLDLMRTLVLNGFVVAES